MTILDVNINSNGNLNYIVIIKAIVCGGTVDDPTFSTSASPPPRGFKMWRWRHGDITEESTNRRFKKNQKDQKAIKANAGITKERNRTVSSQGGKPPLPLPRRLPSLLLPFSSPPLSFTSHPFSLEFSPDALSDAPCALILHLHQRHSNHECPATPAVGAGTLPRHPHCPRGEVHPFSDALR